MKNVPVRSVPALAMWQAAVAKSPPGDELSVHEVEVLASCPVPMRT